MLRNAEFKQPETVRACRPPLPGARWPSRRLGRRIAFVQGRGRAGPGPRRGGAQAGRVRRACDDAPLASRCAFATHPTCWRPGNVVCPQRSPGTCSPAPRPLPSAGNWVRFSCSIPPLFVLSHSMPIINTTGKLASFWRFSITISSISSHSLATVLPLLATRHSPLPPTTLSRWLLPATDRRPPNCQITERARSRRAASLSVCHRTRRFCGQNNLFLSNRRSSIMPDQGASVRPRRASRSGAGTTAAESISTLRRAWRS